MSRLVTVRLFPPVSRQPFGALLKPSARGPRARAFSTRCAALLRALRVSSELRGRISERVSLQRPPSPLPQRRLSNMATQCLIQYGCSVHTCLINETE